MDRRRAEAQAAEEADLYRKLKLLERQLEFLEVQEEYIKDEQKNLKRELLRAQEEVKRIQSVPLVIGQFLEAIDEHYGIVGSTTGSNYYVRILSTLDRCVSRARGVHAHAHASRRRPLTRCCMDARGTTGGQGAAEAVQFRGPPPALERARRRLAPRGPWSVGPAPPAFSPLLPWF